MTDTTTYRITIRAREGAGNNAGASLATAAHQLGLTAVQTITPSRLYFLHGRLSAAEASQLASELLADPVTEQFTAEEQRSGGAGEQGSRGAGEIHSAIRIPQSAIETTLHPGVTDPAAENLLRAAQQRGYEIDRAATGQRYDIEGDLTTAELTRLAQTVLSNPVIQHATLNAPSQPPFFAYHESDGLVETIPLRHATAEQLLQISQTRRLSLNLEEMQAIQAYYQSEEREPTDLELEMLAQTWSEHCVHKTFRARIQYTGPDGREETIDGLLKQYIRAATEKVAKPWVRSAFVDNAGIIAFDENFDLAFKVETHNHPSALEPFGGANTGVGGVIRDVLGVSARPIANTDVLCFGPQELPAESLPEGVLHPRRIQAGVIAGVEDYGNKMGIPTVNGAILYHEGYTANPLVFCGCLGILPHGSNPTQSSAGDLIVALGGRTGRDGLRGATFSSMEMDTSTSDIAGTAVQIGHPIMEKQVQEVILQARDEKLYTAITDCGAGGFSSAVGEMSAELGARIQLQDIPLKYPGLRPWEIWLSEAQERMVLAVPPAHLPRLRELCAGQNVEATVLGTFTGDGRLEIYDGDSLVGQLDEAFLHDGIPQRHLMAKWEAAPIPTGLPPAPPFPPAHTLLTLLRHPNIRSKEETIRLYDHEVQGGTAVKPLVGVANHGPSDGAVLVPINELAEEQRSRGAEEPHSAFRNPQSAIKGIALSNGICPEIGLVDPYHMAWAAVDEAVRNAVAVGADPDQLAILDNFCWGNPTLPDRLGALVRCAQGCYDAAVAYGTPFVSGKDSLYNEYTGADGQKHAIPGTLLISAVGLVPDVARTATMPFKQAGDLLYQIGTTRRELAGSHYALVQNLHPSLSVPPAPLANPLVMYRAVHQAIRQGLVSAVHDCSEGGLAVAAAEMALAGRLGAQINLAGVPAEGVMDDDGLLFSESLGRFLITVPPTHQTRFEALLADNAAPWPSWPSHNGRPT
ncbi:MAG: phosphoribosylformylglycinamidine synthase subunit PurL [Chloroflexi bacterium]|nr:phosphoribosylformylglycinamidine synthase subunit PurL [Chloroflexota bacterium]